MTRQLPAETVQAILAHTDLNAHSLRRLALVGRSFASLVLRSVSFARLHTATQLAESGEDIWTFLDAINVRDSEWRALPLSYQAAVYATLLMAPDWWRVREWDPSSTELNFMWYERWRLSPARAEKVFDLMLAQPWFDVTAGLNRSFRWAARLGYLQVVERLLQMDIVNPADDDNYALQCAAEEGHVDIVTRLLALPSEKGIRTDGKNNYAAKRTAFNGHTETMRLLLADTRTDPSASRNEPLRNATTNGHAGVLRLLLSHPHPGINPGCFNNHSLVQACTNGHLECVQLLVSDNRVNPADGDNEPFRTACRNGHAGIVQFLLTVPNVNPCARRCDGLVTAIDEGHEDVVRVLLQHHSPIRPIFSERMFERVVRRGSPEIVKIFLEDPRVKVCNTAFLKADNLPVLEVLLADTRLDPSFNQNEAVFTVSRRLQHKMLQRYLADERVVEKLTLEEFERFQSLF
ncbi:hypothetical protein HDU84_001965 [Entophlyctis sp. JEL0112]|nr:hypothetical protein HDU84_001965 [Entophlyctis sp. JEL0112]